MSTRQQPLNTGFGPRTTAAEVISGINLAGQVAIVTGGYSGIGLETTRTLLAAGASVIVPARDRAKAASALASLPTAIIEALDLMDPVAVDAFADRFLASGQALSLLVNNAGLVANTLTRDLRGYESSFATNHLGHFQLTARLWPALRRAAGARVVTVSSRGHKRSGIDFDDPNFDRRAYDRLLAYGQSKTANALFAVALDARGQADGVRAYSLHPGGIITGLVRHMSTEELRGAGVIDEQGRPIIDPERNMKTPEQGAATTVWCATSPQLQGIGGVYCENCDIAPTVPADSTELLGVCPWAIDPDLADRLWALSERLTGVTIA